MKQYYFNITGPDGSGKDSVIKSIRHYLNKNELVLFREPGGTPIAEIVRKIILTNNQSKRRQLFNIFSRMNVRPKTKEYVKEAENHYTKNEIGLMETYLYAASRNETSRDVIEKSLALGNNVFGSRSISCSMAYQGNARGVGFDKVWAVNEPVMSRMPDFEIFMDIPTDIAKERLNKRKTKQDRLDLEDEKFHRLSREGYLAFYDTKPFPYYIVDAAQTIEENTKQVLHILDQYQLIEKTNS